MKTKLPALLLTLTLSLTACGAAPAASGSRDSPDLSGVHTLPQGMETPPVDLPTLRLTLVDGAGTDTLLLAGETAGEVYTVPTDSFPLTLDGEPADASVLEDGMPITLAYTGIEESFPARLAIAAAEAYSLGTEKNPGGGFYDLCGLYLQVLSDLAEGGEETVTVDLKWWLTSDSGGSHPGGGEVIVVPKTGDDFPMELMIGAAALALVLLVVLLGRRRARHD